MDTGSILIRLSFIILAILANALFVAAEFALARSRVSKIEIDFAENKLVQTLLLSALDRLNDYISAAQIGITIASLIVGALAERLFSEIFHHLLLDILKLDYLSSFTIETLAFALAIALATSLHVIIGEFIPKTLAIRIPERIAFMTIIPLNLFYKLTLPIVYVLNSIALLVMRPFGVRELSRGEIGYSEDEIKYLLKQSEMEGVIESTEREMVNNVFEFGDTVVREVMTPRTEIIGIEDEITLKEAAAFSLKHNISKLPVYSDNLDNIIGRVNARDLLRALHTEKDDHNIMEVLKPVMKIPESKPISDLLTEFKQSRTKIAIVVDEFGGTSGLVTLEDLIEELVGEIQDSKDEHIEIMQQINDTEWLVSGGMPIGEINENLGSEFSDEHYDTIGGYVFGLIGREPKVGDISKDSDWNFTVLKKGRKIEQVKITRLKIEEPTVTESII